MGYALFVPMLRDQHGETRRPRYGLAIHHSGKLVEASDQDRIIVDDDRALLANRVLVAAPFRVPDRGSGNPTPLGGWECSASHVDWLDGSVQTRQPYRLELQIPLGVDHEVPLSRPWWGRRDSVPGIAA